MPIKSIVPSRKDLLNIVIETGSKAAAAKHYGVSASTMTQWCKLKEIKQTDLPSPYKSIKRPLESELRLLVAEYGRSTYIAKHLGVSCYSVRSWCEQAGIKLSKRASYEPSDKPIILELSETMTNEQIAEKWEVSPRTVADWLREWRAA